MMRAMWYRLLQFKYKLVAENKMQKDLKLKENGLERKRTQIHTRPTECRNGMKS